MGERSNGHLTFRGNHNAGRHGWLRLTPAYSIRLVRDHVAAVPAGAVVTDPFSGTGTTALAAAERGVRGQALDINPFLIWLGQAKTRPYPPRVLAGAAGLVDQVCAAANRLRGNQLWQPSLANIERWWPPSTLDTLRALRAAIGEHAREPAWDLLAIGFCRTLIRVSNAAFNHQSMSFKPGSQVGAIALDEASTAIQIFRRETGTVIASARSELPGSARFVECDARRMAAELLPCDLLLTSPPYVNRMSYIRELRPYMYWLGFLDRPAQAAELDWTAIGGTWGTATSRLARWEPPVEPPIAGLAAVCARIGAGGGTSGPLLATYVRKYFTDIWAHVRAAYGHVRSGGRATYIVGNSSFYGQLVPAEQWYREMLCEVGFRAATVRAIRKRNSKKELYEFEVTASRP